MQHALQISSPQSTEDFKLWSDQYSYRNHEKYDDFISTALDNKNSFFQLFLWKNGTNDKMSKSKEALVERLWKDREILLQLREEENWVLFASTFKPDESATIFNLFLLHIMNPAHYPIYDQHVYRAYHFITTGTIKEIPNNPKRKYESFIKHYLPWFREIRSQHKVLKVKVIDQALFTFGRALKTIQSYPKSILEV